MRTRLIGVVCFAMLCVPALSNPGEMAVQRLTKDAEDSTTKKQLLVQDVGQQNDGKKALEAFLQRFGEAIHIRESKPVRVKDVEFVAVAQTNWKAAKRDKNFPMVARIEIQLRITNLSQSEFIFGTQTIGIRLTTVEGKAITPKTNRKGDSSLRPLLLPKDTSYAWCAGGLLRRDENDVAEFVFFDGTGSESIFGSLAPGQYKLAFTYSAAATDEKNKKGIGDAVPWVGEVVTHEVLIEIAEIPTRGYAGAPRNLLIDFTEPVRIIASKPVTVNGAKFVVAAQADWRSAHPGRFVPIEIQLRITNISNSDLIFPTFDTCRVFLSDASGRGVWPSGGRAGTRFTPPVLIPAGASFSLGREQYSGASCRSADLRCDEKSTKSRLCYFDGTGMCSRFGPLEPGGFKLAFRYGASVKGEAKAGEPAIWSGEVFTEEVSVQVLKH